MTDAGSTMRAAAFPGGDRITIGTVRKPVPAAGEALVRVSRTALCGSDLKLWHKGAEHIAGHEICGHVEQPGHPLHGRLCAVYIPMHCDRCDACLAGDTQMCLTISSLIGWNRDGGYCEYVSVPENCLLPVPEDIEENLAPLLLDTIGTSAHAVREAARLQPGGTAADVLVTGAGPVGLGVILALGALGYRNVHASDPNPHRLAIAESFGARAHPVGSRERRFLTVIECSGAHPARNLAIELVLPHGVIVLVGENAEPWLVTEDKVFRRKDFAMLRTFYFPKRDFDANVELLRADRDRYARLVDNAFDLDALPEKFAAFAAGRSIKPVLAFGGTR